jgi:hypothetical protein
MLVSLRIQPKSDRPPENPFQLLTECHQRIRTFVAMGQRLAGAGGVPPNEVSEAARVVERYFSVGLPKHVDDEDLSLAPRLRELELPPEVRDALRTMEYQHRSLEVILGRLLPLWRELQSDPERLPALTPALAADSGRLALEMEAHLLLEERVLFPFAGRQLPEGSLAALGSELRARRGMAP